MELNSLKWMIENLGLDYIWEDEENKMYVYLEQKCGGYVFVVPFIEEISFRLLGKLTQYAEHKIDEGLGIKDIVLCPEYCEHMDRHYFELAIYLSEPVEGLEFTYKPDEDEPNLDEDVFRDDPDCGCHNFSRPPKKLVN